jgi:hypothetical protein
VLVSICCLNILFLYLAAGLFPFVAGVSRFGARTSHFGGKKCVVQIYRFVVQSIYFGQ